MVQNQVVSAHVARPRQQTEMARRLQVAGDQPRLAQQLPDDSMIQTSIRTMPIKRCSAEAVAHWSIGTVSIDQSE